MGFRSGAYATIWNVEDKGKYTRVNLSISKKNRETDTYETDFSGFVNFVGKAHDAAASNSLKERDRIKIGECDVTTTYNRDTKTSTTRYAIFSFEKMDNADRKSNIKASNTKKDDVVDDDDDMNDDLPF